MTNAHVVAGTDETSVEVVNSRGRTRKMSAAVEQALDQGAQEVLERGFDLVDAGHVGEVSGRRYGY